MSRRQKFEARDKVTRKMSRDGVIERNAATGMDERVSNREAGLDFRGGKRERGGLYQLDTRSGGARIKQKQKRRRVKEHALRADSAAVTGAKPQAATVAEAAQQAAAPITSAGDAPERRENLQAPPLHATDGANFGQSEPLGASQTALKFDDGGTLRFDQQDTAQTPRNAKKRQQQRRYGGAARAQPTVLPPPPHDMAAKPGFSEADSFALNVGLVGARPTAVIASPEGGGDSKPILRDEAASRLHDGKADTPIQAEKDSKLKFDEGETPSMTRSEAKQQKKYGKAQHKADIQSGQADGLRFEERGEGGERAIALMGYWDFANRWGEEYEAKAPLDENDWLLRERILDAMGIGDLRKFAEQRNLILPLYLYDHSGITMSAGDFNDRWDSGQVGWAYVSHKRIAEEYGDAGPENIEKARRCLMAEVKTYDCYLRGECYGFRLYDYGAEADSCWGFLGSFKDAQEAIAEYLPEQAEIAVMAMDAYDDEHIAEYDGGDEEAGGEMEGEY